MARYGHAYRGYSTNSTPSSDDFWSKKGHASDHVCRPVIIDAEGRKMPIIFYGADKNADHYVTKTETIFQQHVHSPLESEYKQSTRLTDDPYGAEDKFRRPMASVNSRPQNVEESITKVQTDASPPKIAPWDASYWRQAPKSTGYEGYDERNVFHNKDLLKPSSNAPRNDSYDDYYRKQGSNKETTMITSEVAKPSATTSPPRSRYRQPAYTETMDSKEAARRYGTRPSTREDSYTSTIDSREAARKYNGSGV
ncbi:hypothetical protein POPTR_005G047000v4 [Populus trichocarpa]|uniref:Uncharacterized protein n=1 Tax=Populus trichocarpa TaxID=3694 RepID=A0ACC0SXS4_POPTR|nr:hypothetical protein BDE02_05G035900 [Populus trichocarpa]KAI9394059.1 hypothetical protein POPTR_005G047000v4 [Populus trichocarpa]